VVRRAGVGTGTAAGAVPAGGGRARARREEQRHEGREGRAPGQKAWLFHRDVCGTADPCRPARGTPQRWS
jgi:hypothetical protein